MSLIPRRTGWSKLWLRQIEVKRSYHNFTYVRTSRDRGRTWSEPRQLRYEAGARFRRERAAEAELSQSQRRLSGKQHPGALERDAGRLSCACERAR